MKILVMGGTRFVGKALVKELLADKHDITLFTRGNNPVPTNVTHVLGDRNTESINKLAGKNFDVIIDSSGRKANETKELLKLTGNPNHRFIYISSAGVYSDTALYPYSEKCIIDPNSRHFGKVETENWLIDEKVPFTSFRPTYIYGPGNYNPIENWFFDKITNDKVIPVPDNGELITQLGHVKDLANAIILSIANMKSTNKIYNCSGEHGITINGLIETAARVCNKDFNQLHIESFDSSKLDAKGRKIFPVRLNHFLTDISLIKNDLNWSPKFDLYNGLLDSFNNDFIIEKK